jgi:ribonuclease-3
MTKTRASLVCEYSLAACARELVLGDYLFLSKGEDVTGGRQRDSILADALESLFGAIYLDGGIEPASALIHRILLKDIESKQLFYDAKTILQELVQSKKNQVLVYRVVKEEGPDHNKEFTIEAVLNDEVVGRGVGRSKKSAEQQAAYEALMNLQE